jgi:hypothetical protein
MLVHHLFTGTYQSLKPKGESRYEIADYLYIVIKSSKIREGIFARQKTDGTRIHRAPSVNTYIDHALVSRAVAAVEAAFATLVALVVKLKLSPLEAVVHS